MSHTPASPPLDTTPAGLLKLADRLDADSDCLLTVGRDYSNTLTRAAQVLRALAPSSPPAPQEREPDSCRWFAERPHPDLPGRIQVAWFATEADAECQIVDWGAGHIWENPRYVEAALLAPAVPDHAGLVKAIEALPRITPSELGAEEQFNRNGEYVSLYDVLEALK